MNPSLSAMETVQFAVRKCRHFDNAWVLLEQLYILSIAPCPLFRGQVASFFKKSAQLMRSP